MEFKITSLDGSSIGESNLMHISGLDSYGCHFAATAIDQYGDIIVLDKCGNYASLDSSKFKIRWV